MAITLTDITEIDLNGNGSFDKLMRAVRLHINDAVNNNEITQGDAGEIYTNVIPSIVQQAVQFEMQKDALTAQLEQEQIKTKMMQVQLDQEDRKLELLNIDSKLKQKQLEDASKRLKLTDLQITQQESNLLLLGKEIDTKDIQLQVEKDTAKNRVEEMEIKVASEKLQKESIELDNTIKDEKWKLDRDTITIEQQLKAQEVQFGVVREEAERAKTETLIADNERKADLHPFEMELAESKISTTDKQLEVSEEQRLLYKRQKEGFDYDQQRELTKAVISMYNVNQSASYLAENRPDVTLKGNIDHIVTQTFSKLNIEAIKPS